MKCRCIVKLKGGLGNQMFQYAFGLALAQKSKRNLLLDLSFYETPDNTLLTNRKFKLRNFNINPEIFTDDRHINIFNWVYKKIFPDQYIEEIEYKYHEIRISNFSKSVFVDGYWQNEKYFESIKNEIRNTYQFNFDFNSELFKYLNMIEGEESVAIHFRRGDYISNKIINEYHGTCSFEYYNSAINYISKKNESIKIFIFSDDIEWVRINFFNEKFIYIENIQDEISELFLMSKCKHQIIANSSFSWWAAWLNNYKEKIVIAPSKWFKNNETDIVPPNWIKI